MVGYQDPPKEPQWKPGQSGNPAGRPRGAKNKPKDLTDENFKAMLLEEAYRPVSARDGGSEVTMSMAQVIISSVANDAARGNSRAQKLFLDALRSVEASDAKKHQELVTAVVQYKKDWEAELAHCERHGLTPPPAPVPHPDDFLIDPETTEVSLIGPLTREEKGNSDWFYERWEKIQDDYRDLKEELKNAKTPEDKKQVQVEIDNNRRLHAVFDKDRHKFQSLSREKNGKRG